MQGVCIVRSRNQSMVPAHAAIEADVICMATMYSANSMPSFSYLSPKVLNPTP